MKTTRTNFLMKNLKSMGFVTLLSVFSFVLFTSAKEVKKEEIANNPDSCFIISKHEWGKRCNSSTSLRVWFKNQCYESKRIHFSFKLADGSWEKGSALVRPGEETTYYVCYADADGTVEWRDSNP